MKDCKINLVIKLSDEHKIWEACGHNTITIVSYLNVYLEIEGMKVRIDIDNLIPLLKHLNMFDYFKEETFKEIEKLQNYFINFKDVKNRLLEDSNRIYYKDINILYDNSGCYSIVLTSESGRDKIIDIWRKYLEEIENGKKK